MRRPWTRSPVFSRTKNPSRSTDVIDASSADSPGVIRDAAERVGMVGIHVLDDARARRSASGSGAAAA